MATVLDQEIVVNQESKVSGRLSDSSLPQIEAEQDYEVVFVTENSSLNEKSFDFALETANKFSARLVLLYATSREVVPEAYLEYSRSEGIQDYEWRYYNMIANERMEPLAKLAKSAGVESNIRVHIGDAKSAVKALSGRRAIVIVNKPSEKKGLFGFISTRKPSVPVLVY